MNNDTKYDSDDDDVGPPPAHNNGAPLYDANPERQERIRQMVAASSQSNVMQDDQVTDFVLRMAEKNQKMMDQQPQQPQQKSPPPPRHTISDSSEDSNGSDLDASYNNHRINQHSERMNKNKQKQRHNTPDEYPPGEAFEDEAAEIPSYDPKEDDAISYSRLCCVACALVIGMIATSVLILVFVVIADGEDSTHKAHHGGNFDGMVLPFAPSNLKELCQLTNLKTFQGVLDCREPCMRAACCWEKGERGQQPVCWESHPLECAPYESCVNLLQAGTEQRPDGTGGRPTSTVPRAPDGVSACRPETINSVDQVLLCENACRVGECCWKTGSGSQQKCHTDPNCDDYKPCQVLNQGGSAAGSGTGTSVVSTSSAENIPAAPINLSEVCSQQSVQACESACAKASCCWKLATNSYEGPLGETITESVLGSCAHETVCDGYKPCKDMPADAQASSSATGSTSAASTSAGSNTNFQNVAIPTAPSNLAATCTASLEGSCATQCYKAPCCWQLQTHAFTGPLGEIVTESVLGACSHREECAGYEPCKALPKKSQPGGTPAPTAAPANVAEQQTNLEAVCGASLEGVCTDTCNQAQCCWKMATSTYTGPLGETMTESVQGTCAHLAECKAYEPCKQLPEALASHVHEIVPAPMDLASTCAAAQDGVCRNTCNQATCCWKLAITTMEGPHGSTITESVLGSCSHSHSLECAGYEPCKKLPEATHPPPETTPTAHLNIPAAPDNLTDTCDRPTLSNLDIHLCREYCNAATCCWKKETHTFEGSSGETITESQQGSCAHQIECEAYRPCSVLDSDVYSPHSPAVDPTPAPAPVEAPPTSRPPFSSTTEYTEEVIFDVCYNHEGTKLCEQVCDPGSCCYKADEDCANDGSIDCGKYEPCKVLNQANGNGVQSEVEKACSDLSDLAPCVQQCSKGTCCFTTDFGKTCDVAAPTIACSEYTPCEVLYRASSNP
ncbi:expressed unknown protein [Seminavis robusta]|uniref:Uncharacterized protein n=1 Tax=Seminavis robusta TaxID=568900 RepID=A0A9N8EAS4_9STRA|nr:expressed unknown protein [Seminavis robusta]|eukprot:Sro686_g187150.1 n/a (960) ;mRNA; f:44080-47330